MALGSRFAGSSGAARGGTRGGGRLAHQDSGGGSRMKRIALALAIAALLAACGGKRSDAEHLLITWADALNHHLATSSEGNYTYPHALAEIDPLLRVALPFEDPWGHPLQYRRIDDGHYDLVSSAPTASSAARTTSSCTTGCCKSPPRSTPSGRRARVWSRRARARCRASPTELLRPLPHRQRTSARLPSEELLAPRARDPAAPRAARARDRRSPKSNRSPAPP